MQVHKWIKLIRYIRCSLYCCILLSLVSLLLFISFFSLHIVNDKNPILNELHVNVTLVKNQANITGNDYKFVDPPLPPQYLT